MIGGSIGLAAKKKKIARTVVGIGRNPERLDRAVRRGAIDLYFIDPAEGLSDADLIILCLPVEQIIALLPRVAEYAPAGSLVTDVGSTKKVIMERAAGCFGKDTAMFIGSHPLAGSEKTGIEHAKAGLFKDATCSSMVLKYSACNLRSSVPVMASWSTFFGRWEKVIS